MIWKTFPAENPTRAGHWTAIYKGDSPSANPNWTEITKPGDVINLVFNSGAQHTLSVISVSGKNIETIDNSAGFIGGRVYSPENQSSPTSVTVYRMDSAYDSSASRTFNWLEGLYPSFFPGGATTELSNGYVLRQYSTKWALGVKNGALYVLNGSTLRSYSIGSTESFLQFANRNGF